MVDYYQQSWHILATCQRKLTVSAGNIAYTVVCINAFLSFRSQTELN